MKHFLDASHHTLLKNFETFQRAQRCLEEIKEYLSEVLRGVEMTLPGGAETIFRFKLDKGGWLQAEALPNALKSEPSPHHFISIGIDYLNVEQIIDTGECQAYVYCGLLADDNKTQWHGKVGAFLRQLPAPIGFSLGTPSQEGYVFMKRLGKLPVDQFASPLTLKDYFLQPLLLLVEWLNANATVIATFGQSVTL